MQPENPSAGSSPSGEQGMAMSGGISIACYENEKLPFIEGELERLYGNVFSSLAHFRIYGGAENAKAYVVRKDGEVIGAWLFRQEEKKVRILNEGIEISEEEIRRFAQYMFTTFQSVNVVSFHAVKPEIRRFSFPYQRFNCTEDIILPLPNTEEEYLQKFGKASRKNIKHHLSRLKRSFPTFGFDIYQKEEVNEQHVREIIDLNRKRMAGKNKASGIGDDETERIIKLVKLRGLVSVVTIDGRVCAGTICSHVGENYSSHVTAHDPAYDNYRLGTLCCYMTICACIKRGGKEFHLLWGRYEYKYALLGVQRDLDDLVIYRSYPSLLRNADLAMKTAFRGCIRRARLWLANALSRNDFMWRTALNFAGYLRSLKRF